MQRESERAIVQLTGDLGLTNIQNVRTSEEWSLKNNNLF